MTPGALVGPEAVNALLAAPMMQSMPLRVLTAFVTINTVIYSVLAVAKILPRVYPSTWFQSRNRRAEDRSIFPAAALATAAREPDDVGGVADDGATSLLEVRRRS